MSIQVPTETGQFALTCYSSQGKSLAAFDRAIGMPEDQAVRDLLLPKRG